MFSVYPGRRYKRRRG